MKRLVAILTTILIISSLSLPAVARSYYGKHLCAYPQFTCIPVKSGDTWTRLFPNTSQRELVKRLNRTNTPLRNRRWIVVPNDLGRLTLMDLSPFPAAIKAQGKRLLIVNLPLHAFAAYDPSGKLVHWGPVSGGKDWCDDIDAPCQTATGTYQIIRKQGAECESSKFPVETDGGAPMPYCMHYYRGFALHASRLPGYHASHGCIRLFYKDAKWLNEHFADIGTKIIVME